MWETVRLGDVASVTAGQSPKGDTYNRIGDGVPFYQGKKDYGPRFLNPPQVWTTSPKKFAEKDDIIISVRAPVGALNVATQKVCIGRGLAAIRGSGRLLNDYLFYVLLNISVNLEGTSGAIFNSINKKQIEDISLPLPPLAEQKRIVERLDKAFAEIDKAIATAEAKEVEVERLKASTLSAMLNRRNWEMVRLGEVCDFAGGSQPPKRDFVYEPQDGYVRLIQIRDFKSDKNIRYVPATKANRLCSEEDILIGRYGASVGKILRGLSGSYNVALMKVLPDERILDKGWLHTYLTSPMFQKPLVEVSSRSAQNGFSKKDIHDFRFPLPPLEEQLRMAEEVERYSGELRFAKETIEVTIANYAALKAAILKQGLTPSEAV